MAGGAPAGTSVTNADRVIPFRLAVPDTDLADLGVTPERPRAGRVRLAPQQAVLLVHP
jgi:hypothetical protein